MHLTAGLIRFPDFLQLSDVPENLLQFEGQTKGKLGTTEAKTAVDALVFEKLSYFLEEKAAKLPDI